MPERNVYNATERARKASAPKRARKKGSGSRTKKTEAPVEPKSEG